MKTIAFTFVFPGRRSPWRHHHRNATKSDNECIGTASPLRCQNVR